MRRVKMETYETVDLAEVYNILLASGFQHNLFDLSGKRGASSGKETKATCPFCEKEKHFYYSNEKPLFLCHRCGEKGDWIQYLEKRKGMDFLEALHFLAEQAGVDVSDSSLKGYQAYAQKSLLLEEAQKFFVESLWSAASEKVISYLLSERGYTEEDVKAMGLGAYVSSQALVDHLGRSGYTLEAVRNAGLLTKGFGQTHTVTLLWRDSAGKAAGLICRSHFSREALRQKKIIPYLYSAGLQKSKGFIGFESVRGSDTAVIVEGVLDAAYVNAKLEAKGLRAKVVGLGGTSLSAGQLKALEHGGTRELLLALDSDQAGQDGTDKIIRLCLQSKIRPYVVELPSGYKDPDELVRGAGIEAFEDALVNAKRWSAWRAKHLVRKHDLSQPRGMDAALFEALECYASIQDSIEARDFLSALSEATGLSELDLEARIAAHKESLHKKKATDVLQSLSRNLQRKLDSRDLIGAELELSEGLQELRKTRGIVEPEPYRKGDLLTDLESIGVGLLTGYESLDSRLSIPTGAITVIAGRPGHGKTTLMLNLFVNMIRKYEDAAFYFFSYEEAKSRLAVKLIQIMAGEVIDKNFNHNAYIGYLTGKNVYIGGTQYGERREAIDKAIKEYTTLADSRRLWLVDQRLYAEDLAAMLSGLSEKQEIGAVFVDYIQKVPIQTPGQGGQRYLEIKQASALLLEQAVNHDLPIIVGAQLNRTANSGNRIKLEHLRESGDIEQDANLAIGLFNESVAEVEESEQADKLLDVDLELRVLKNRAGVAGTKFRLNFNKPTLRITDDQVAGLY